MTRTSVVDLDICPFVFDIPLPYGNEWIGRMRGMTKTSETLVYHFHFILHDWYDDHTFVSLRNTASAEDCASGILALNGVTPSIGALAHIV